MMYTWQGVVLSIDGMIRSVDNGITIYSWRVFEPWKERITVGITGRTGGFSAPPLHSLNLGHLVDDDPSVLDKNRAEVAAALGVPEASWAVANQIHGTRIGMVNHEPEGPFDSCDALYVSKKGIIAAILLADCLPVAVYDPGRLRGIICHAGWRGTAAGIAEVAVKHLVDDGSRLENLIAATGPGIGPCCYPVGKEVVQRFRHSFDYQENVILNDGEDGYRLDLEEANLVRLRASGLKEENLGRAGFCTACRREEFFSYRKDGEHTGRHASLMILL